MLNISFIKNSVLTYIISALCAGGVLAAENVHQSVGQIADWVGIAVVLVFALAYVLVILEEKIHLRKSKPVMLAAAIIWALIGFAYSGDPGHLEDAIRHNFLEYGELFFFLLVAMTYVNTLLDRGVFDALRDWLISRGYTYRALFWWTGILAFFISPIADNLTTALIMCAVVLTVAEDNPKFVSVACINIVVAANAGGAFSPFGDITTLMVWQKGVLEFQQFFQLFVPSLVNFLVPAVIMQFFVPKERPALGSSNGHALKRGGLTTLFLFLMTIVTAVCFHNFLHIPPVFGMMAGLAYLKIYGFFLRRYVSSWSQATEVPPGSKDDPYDFDVFAKIAQAEWDTLFFFYGVIMSVGGISFLGYLDIVSQDVYGTLSPTTANTLVGVLSAVIDNIPVMFAVLTMYPEMSETQWLLVTLTAGVGGSLLSIGSAAGVALMGQARGKYTFFSHLKWTPVISLGYAASILVHLLIST